MLTRKLIEAAAFWHQDLCLECGSPQDAPTAPGDSPLICESCSSPDLIEARLAQRLLEALDAGEGDAPGS